MLNIAEFGQESQATDNGHVLSLIGQDITEFNVAPNDAHQVFHLDLSYNLLEKADGLKRFVGLRELVLDNNRLNDLPLPLLPFLHTLSVNKNRLWDLGALLEKLTKCTPQIEYLSLLGNALCPNELVSGDEEDYQNYRYCVINKLKYLKFLDSRAVVPAEREIAERVVHFIPVGACPHNNIASLPPEDLFRNSPLNREQNMDNRVDFGRRKHEYNGKSSEGNKYISDGDL